MSRNKILEATGALFAEKGFDATTMQDIMARSGLSKGAIYHHFKSKEEILEAATNRMTAESNQMLAEVRDRKDLTGKEKLKMIFYESINRPVQNDLFTAAPGFHNNPKLFFSLVHDTVTETAIQYIQPIFRQGVADGTIRTEYPEQLAELVMLAANVWMNPMTFDSTAEETRRKFMVFRQMMEGFGLDIIDDRLMDRIVELAEIYQAKQ